MLNIMHTREILFDGNKFADLESFYNEIDNVLTKNLDWQTGHNLDAFNDLLRGGFGVHEYEESMKITWTNSLKSKNDLGFEATIKYLTNKLKTCHPTNKELISADLEEAKMHRGKTLFEIIIDIIKEHNHIELIMA
jgi:RNAse (barnase) inhibitor barstar